MKGRNIKKKILAQVMVVGLLAGAVPWIPTDIAAATEADEEQVLTSDDAGVTDTETADMDNSGNQTGEEPQAGAETEAADDSTGTDTGADANNDADTLESEDPGSNARSMEEEPVSNARYDGITIDGDFSDWDAVAKYDTNYAGLDKVAMVWDGDMIYLYFMMTGNGDGSGNWNSVTWSGPNGNGNFAITTDLGNTLKFQLCGDATVAGVDGASVAVNNKDWDKAPHMWEVSIPSSALPAYKNTISLGYYAGDTLISSIANLKGSSGTDSGSGSESGSDTGENTGTGSENDNAGGITIDGNYGDWENYPHNLIQYSTNGSYDSKPDGEAALYMSGKNVYAHVRTEMLAHLQEAGGEFTQAVTVRLNGKYDFYPMFVTVDANGNINSVNTLSGLAAGTYELYLIDSQGWQVNGVSLSELQTEAGREKYHNAVYGHMYMTVGASKDDMEFVVDLELVAQKFGMDSDNIRTVEAQWGRIGQQWVSAAGTSTGTWLGLLICFAAVGVSAEVSKRRKRIAG